MILFIHGSFLNSRVWDHQAFSFSDSHQVVRVDLRGHGGSDNPATGYSYARYGQDIEELVHHLSIDSLIVVGWSMGAIVAVEFIEDNQNQVEKLGLVSTGMFHQISENNEREQNYIPYQKFMQQIQTQRPEAMKWFIDNISADNIDEASKRWLWNLTMDSAIQANVETMEAASKMNPIKIRGILNSLDIPVGVFHGSLDKAATVQEAKFVSQHLVSDGEFFEYDESQHIPFLSQPDKFEADLADFIEN